MGHAHGMVDCLGDTAGMDISDPLGCARSKKATGQPFGCSEKALRQWRNWTRAVRKDERGLGKALNQGHWGGKKWA